MGGRKEYRIRDVFGSSRNINADRKEFIKNIKKEDSRGLALSSTKVVIDSEKAIDVLEYAFEFIGYVVEQALKSDIRGSEDVLKKASEAWAKIKRERKIETVQQIDKIIVESAVKAIRGQLK